MTKKKSGKDLLKSSASKQQAITKKGENGPKRAPIHIGKKQGDHRKNKPEKT